MIVHGNIIVHIRDGCKWHSGKCKRECIFKQYRRRVFNITTFDLAGNNQTVNQTNLTSSNLTIDHTNPTLSNLTIYSNNANPSLATVNNNLTITITANETLKAANITILGSTYSMSVNDAMATANVTVSQDSAEGDVSIQHYSH